MQDAATLRSLAEKFRRLAADADEATARNLLELAEEYERLADQEPDAEPPMPVPD